MSMETESFQAAKHRLNLGFIERNKVLGNINAQSFWENIIGSAVIALLKNLALNRGIEKAVNIDKHQKKR